MKESVVNDGEHPRTKLQPYVDITLEPMGLEWSCLRFWFLCGSLLNSLLARTYRVLLPLSLYVLLNHAISSKRDHLCASPLENLSIEFVPSMLDRHLFRGSSSASFPRLDCTFIDGREYVSIFLNALRTRTHCAIGTYETER